MSDLLYAGSASAPSAGGVVVESGALADGHYRVDVTTFLEGTGTPATGTDDNNMALYSGTTELGALAVVTAKNVQMVTYGVNVSVADQAKISVQAVANATASVIYAASLVVHQSARF